MAIEAESETNKVEDADYEIIDELRKIRKLLEDRALL
jgi:hypothetical protein